MVVRAPDSSTVVISAIEIDGDSSSSVMVNVADSHPSITLALLGLERVIVRDSSDSSIESESVETVNVFDV